MADIVLTTLNAGYAHCAFGLRCLMANLGDLAPGARLLEFGMDMRTADIAEAVLSLKPRIVGLGVYVWNAAECARLAAELRRLRPDLVIVLGGPEISYETSAQAIYADADYAITGEGELAFARLCARLLSGERPGERIIAAPPPDPAALALPYALYTDEDIAHRVIYAEASRGCPFACDFCLSALCGPVRQFPRERLFAAWTELLDRGARRFKFVDRTFNLDTAAAASILEFFLERQGEGLFLHFEMVPDRFPEELFSPLRRFPPGSLQLEIGVQTFNEAVAARINRRQDNAAAEKNLARLRRETGAHIHADLIAGLPGEDLRSFAVGFDRLAALDPHEIQVGILKRLRGAPIARHDTGWEMVYSPYPPYELRRNGLLDFFTMQRLRRFARYWDLVANSGVFRETSGFFRAAKSPFGAFMDFSDWLYGRTRSTHDISRARLRSALSDYLTGALGHPPAEVAARLERDAANSRRRAEGSVPRRQSLHRG